MFVYPKSYDVIVVGAGHAGIEAALAAARMGCETLLLTLNLDTVGQMSCNPAIGGLAKGHLAREVDAMGGEMGLATDMTGLQFRMLNLKKGPSVWAPRAQCDKKAYQFYMKWACEKQPRLDLRQAQTTALLHEEGMVQGVQTNLETQYHGKTVIVTTGTFLRGLMHIGLKQDQGGRAGEGAAMSLSDSLRDVGLELGRLKTGTPPRLLKKTIDFSRTQVQPGDEPVPYFSYWVDELFHVEHSGRNGYPRGSVLERIDGQLPCYVTYTTEATAKIIKANLDRSPLYTGVIAGVGPRYCPSIEDKIVKFPHREQQQIFLEPEGAWTDEVYVNGFSTSLPFDVQVQMVRTIIGCERAELVRPAYAVEYDFAFPTQLYPSLETKVCRNLFLAGQINGTSGYEEAAGQGLMAGINAARRVQNKPPVVLRRDQAYIGVLIDDLVTKGTIEPYRMFTSRAEYRLLLRQDNADMRLSEIGNNVGLLAKERHQKYLQKKLVVESELARLRSTRDGQDTLEQVLRRPATRYDDLPGARTDLAPAIVSQIETEIKYAGYIARQQTDVERFKSQESKVIPPGFDYSQMCGLRTEARVKLEQIRPLTVGQASRISGVSPSDIAVLMVWLKRAGG